MKMRALLLSALLFLISVTGCSDSAPAPSTAEDTTGAESTATGSPVTQTASASATQTPQVDAAQLMADVKTAYKAGDYRAAFPMLDQLHAANQCPAEGYAIRAQILDHSGLVPQAISSLTIAITKQPDNAEWHNMLGLLFVKLQNRSMAQQAFEKAIALQPDFSKAYNNRGLMFISVNEFGQAIENFNLAIKHDPDYVDAFNNRGYAYLEQANYARAIEDFTAAVELDADYVKGFNNRGFAQLKLGDAKAALADFTTAIELSPYVIKHYLHRRDAYLALGDEAAAEADRLQAVWVRELLQLTRDVRREPNNPQLLITRAEHFAKNQKFDEAFTDLRAAEQVAPDEAKIFRCRANIYFNRQEYQAAITACTKALELEPDFTAWSLRGDAYLALGKYDEAIADFSSARRIDGVVAVAYRERATLREKAGDEAGAAQDRQAAAKLDPALQPADVDAAGAPEAAPAAPPALPIDLK